MLVIPPGLSEEEEALQKKFNKLKKKVRGRQACWLARLFQTLRAPGMRVRLWGFSCLLPEADLPVELWQSRPVLFETGPLFWSSPMEWPSSLWQ